MFKWLRELFVGKQYVEKTPEIISTEHRTVVANVPNEIQEEKQSTDIKEDIEKKSVDKPARRRKKKNG